MNIINKKRITLSLPRDASDEEIINVIAKAMGVAKEQVPLLNKAKSLNYVDAQRNEVELIKATYLSMLNSQSKKEQALKYEELDDVSRFIYAANNTSPKTSQLQLNVPPEPERFPDFTLFFNNKKIGLEHTRLMNSFLKARNVTLKHCLQRAEDMLKQLSYLSKTVIVFFDYDKQIQGIDNFHNKKLNKAEKAKVATLIANYIKSELKNEELVKPDFIKMVQIVSNNESRIDIGLGEDYNTSIEFAEILINLIKVKEAKALSYRKAVNVEFLWLLIVIDDINSYSGFNVEGPFFPSITKSNFDCILIFEKFGMTISVLYSK